MSCSTLLKASKHQSAFLEIVGWLLPGTGGSSTFKYHIQKHLWNEVVELVLRGWNVCFQLCKISFLHAYIPPSQPNAVILHLLNLSVAERRLSLNLGIKRRKCQALGKIFSLTAASESLSKNHTRKIQHYKRIAIICFKDKILILILIHVEVLK